MKSQKRPNLPHLNRAESESAPVISGILQGWANFIYNTVYTSMIFLKTDSEGLLYADDTKIFHHIATGEDAVPLTFRLI